MAAEGRERPWSGGGPGEMAQKVRAPGFEFQHHKEANKSITQVPWDLIPSSDPYRNYMHTVHKQLKIKGGDSWEVGWPDG